MDSAEHHFQHSRRRLMAIAYRLLGSAAEAEDVVQETWLRLSRTKGPALQNPEAWLTTVVTRVALDVLRSREIRREEEVSGTEAKIQSSTNARSLLRPTDPEQEALLAESVGLALVVVLNRLTAAERVSFVMHDVFALSFEELAPVLNKTPAAIRQLASRARRRVHRHPEPPSAELTMKHSVVSAFLEALRAGDLPALLAVLDPDLVVTVDESTAATGEPRVTRGAATWAKQVIAISRGARFTQAAWVGDDLGVLVAPNGRLLRILQFRFRAEKICSVEILSDARRLEETNLSVISLPSPRRR